MIFKMINDSCEILTIFRFIWTTNRSLIVTSNLAKNGLGNNDNVGVTNSLQNPRSKYM